MRISNMPMMGKVLVIVALTSAGAAALGGLGLYAATALRGAVTSVDAAGDSALLGMALEKNVLELSRAEFRLAADPSRSAEIEREIDAAREALEADIAALQALSSAEIDARLAAIERRLETYRGSLDTMVAAAAAIETSARSAGETELLALARASRENAAALRAEVVELVATFDQRADIEGANAAALADTTRTTLILGAIAAVIGGLVLGALIGRQSVSQPLKRAIVRVESLAKGDLDTAVEETARGDEVGTLNRALEVFQSNMREQARLRASNERAARRKLEQAEALAALTDAFEDQVGESVAALASAAEELRATATSMAATAEQTAGESTSVSASTDQTANNIQMVASATEELSTSIREVGQQIARTAEIADRAAGKVAEAIEGIEDLETSSKEIGTVLDLISTVTEQTKLLALNATIEAARAGEAGKGFAVVAAEVRQLAEQTERATGEVTAKIAAIQSRTRDAAEAVREIDTVVGEVSDVSTAVAAAAEQQVAATTEISRNVNEAASGSESVSRSVASLTEASEATSAAASQVSSTAQSVAERAATIRGQITDYLREAQADDAGEQEGADIVALAPAGKRAA